jgi:hypothetical protein
MTNFELCLNRLAKEATKYSRKDALSDWRRTTNVAQTKQTKLRFALKHALENARRSTKVGAWSMWRSATHENAKSVVSGDLGMAMLKASLGKA